MARFHIERFRKLVRTALALAIIGGPTACSRTGFSPPDARSRDHLPADSLPADSLAADRLPADARTGDHLPADSLAADAVAADTATTGDISPGADGSSFSLGPQSRIVNRLDSVTFSGTCTASVAVSGAETAVLGCSAGGWTFRATPVSTDGLRSFDFTSAGVTLSASWIRDTAPPRLVADGMQLSGGAGIARSHFASVTLAAEDDESSVVAVCLALEPIAPAPEAACWVRVEDLPGAPAAGPAVALPQVPIRLGFAPGFYDIYAWVQDEAGNSSSLTNAGAGTSGLDRLNALYVPLAPPSVQVLAATSTDSPTAPPSQQQLSVLPGASLYIKWAAQDDEPLGARPIEVAYTTDDLHYTTIASALVNGANGACTPDAPNTTADDGATGCFLWQGGAPSAGFFRVRVIATDANGTSSAAVSTPLNTNAVLHPAACPAAMSPCAS